MTKLRSRQCVVCGINIRNPYGNTKACSAACRQENKRRRQAILAQSRYASDPEKFRERRRGYRLNNLEKEKDNARRSYQKHREERNAKRRFQYQNDPMYREKAMANSASYRTRNADKLNEYARKQREQRNDEQREIAKIYNRIWKKKQAAIVRAVRQLELV